MWESKVGNIRVCELGNPKHIRKIVAIRKCEICKSILSSYNLGKKCFRHPEDTTMYVTTIDRNTITFMKRGGNANGQKHKAHSSTRH